MRFLCCLLALACLLAGQTPARAAMSLDDLIFYGSESLARGRFPQANDAFAEALRRDPQNPYARGRLALAQAATGQTDKARRTLEEAIAARGDDLFALWTLGCLDLLENKPQAASPRFAALLAADPDNPRGLVGLGLAALAEGRLADGLDQLDKLRRAGGQDPLARHLAGLAYWMLDAPANARLELEATLELDPQNAAALELLGLVYRRLGKASLAKSAWEQALALAPNRPRARFFLSRLAQDEGLAAALADKPEAAKRAYERALAIDPSNMAAAKGLGLPTLNTVAPQPAKDATGKAQPQKRPAPQPCEPVVRLPHRATPKPAPPKDMTAPWETPAAP